LVLRESFLRSYFFVLSFGFSQDQNQWQHASTQILNICPFQQGSNEFFNDFPAAIWLTVCTVLLLQWVAAFTPRLRTFGRYEKIILFFVVINIAVYLLMLVLFGVLVYFPYSYMILVKTILTASYLFVLVTVLFGVQYFSVRSYLVFKNSELHHVGRNMVILFQLFTGFTLARIAFMLEAIISQRDSTFILGGNTTGWLFFTYYFVGEIVPSCLLLLIQYYMCLQDLNSEVSTLWESIPVAFEKKRSYTNLNSS